MGRRRCWSFTFGGGSSQYGSQYGWAASMITQYEIALADSRILGVSQDS